jgi:hypothetical protein
MNPEFSLGRGVLGVPPAANLLFYVASERLFSITDGPEMDGARTILASEARYTPYIMQIVRIPLLL